MSNFCIMISKRYKDAKAIKNISNHNVRAPGTEVKGLIPNKSHLNTYEGAQTPKELFAFIQKRIKTCTSKPRPDANKLMEFVFTASPKFFDSNDKTTHEAYFNKAKKWAEDRFGKENIAQIAIHYDEKTPHMHVLIVPIKTELHPKTGKEVVKLNAKGFFNGYLAGVAMQDDYYDQVGKPFNLDRGISSSITKAKHVDPEEFWRKSDEYLAKLAENERQSAAARDAAIGFQIEQAAINVELNQKIEQTADKYTALDMKMGEYNQRQLDMRAREERSFKKEDELSAREKKILDDEKNISQRLKKIEADEVSISRRVEQINQDEIDARDILNNCLTVWNRLDNFQKGQFENMYPDETYQINRAMEILFNDDQNNDSASSMTL